jgi:hypothetical protein
MTPPAVPSAVSSGEVREGNDLDSASEQCPHSPATGLAPVRQRGLCQHPDGDGARMGGMATPGERARPIVTANQPKGLRGLRHKGTVAGTRRPPCLVMGSTRSRWTARASPTRMFLGRHLATPDVSHQGTRAGRRAHSRAGRSGWQKPRPSCRGVERGGASGTPYTSS